MGGKQRYADADSGASVRFWRAARGVADWKRDKKRTALPQDACRGNIPSMPPGNLAADRQADSGALVFGPAMQTLEHGKDPVQVFLVKADALVFHDQPEHAVRVPSEVRLFRIHTN